MIDFIKKVFTNQRINQVGILSAINLTIINPSLLPKDTVINSCIVFLVPYNVHEEVQDSLGVSVYARIRDYHIYFRELFERIIPALEARFPGERFFGYADHSPINEKLAAASAGLGVIGRNSLLINAEYGSYIFIGELLTTLSLLSCPQAIRSCGGCGLCLKTCPTKAIGQKGIIREQCLSHISQKRTVSEEELSLLRKSKIVWGCDFCQSVCPMNKGKNPAIDSYFTNKRLSNITEELITDMPEQVINTYPFAWRGRDVILRNIRNIGKTSE